MDYSGYYMAIQRYFFEVFASSILVLLIFPIYIGYHLYKGYKETKAKRYIWIGAILFVVSVFLSFTMVNEAKDIPNAIHNEYIVTTGTAIGWSISDDDSERRGFAFLTDDGKEVDLSVLPCPKVYQGDRLEVIYLPNSGIGAIIQWLDDSD